MSIVTMQEALDTVGYYRFPVGETSPTVPLFMESDTRVQGGGPRSQVNCYYSRFAVVAGFERGRVPDWHYTPDGFVTGEGEDHCHLWCTASEFSNGPTIGRWAGVTKLRIHYIVSLLDGGGWHGVGICGISGDAKPEPYCVVCEEGHVVLYIQTTDRKVYRFAVPVAGTMLDHIWVVDLVAGTVDFNSGTITTSEPMLAGAKLYSSYNHGWSAGSLRPTAGARGHWFGNTRNLCIHRASIIYNDMESTPCNLYPRNGRPGTYIGGPSLPLLPCQPGGWALVVPHAASPYRVKRVEIDDLNIQGHATSPAVLAGWVEGGLSVTRSRITDCTRAVDMITSGVAYPVYIKQCELEGHDTPIALTRAGVGSVIDGCQLKYAGRTSMHLTGCMGLTIRDIMEAPSNNSANCCIWADGGAFKVDGWCGDYESGMRQGFRGLLLRPNSWDGEEFATDIMLDRFSFRSNDGVYDPLTLGVLPSRVSYRGNTKVTINGTVRHLNMHTDVADPHMG